MPQHRVVELERVLQLIERSRVAFDVHEDVMGLVDLGDRIRKLPASPIFHAMNATVARGDHRAIALGHGGHLPALVGTHDGYDLLMLRAECSLWPVVQAVDM